MAEWIRLQSSKLESSVQFLNEATTFSLLHSFLFEGLVTLKPNSLLSRSLGELGNINNQRSLHQGVPYFQSPQIENGVCYKSYPSSVPCVIQLNLLPKLSNSTYYQISHEVITLEEQVVDYELCKTTVSSKGIFSASNWLLLNRKAPTQTQLFHSIEMGKTVCITGYTVYKIVGLGLLISVTLAFTKTVLNTKVCLYASQKFLA